ncbi:unnamed protein product [Paramecium pentaurelia]|uniref:Uncharacterized protein n=1 Tax=Paramecium pentaurelia TaxID=43138 RepID=A0A8S1YJ81_9CILI|nr:unnamed protein product [Paramecium pentaurelia]
MNKKFILLHYTQNPPNFLNDSFQYFLLLRELSIDSFQQRSSLPKYANCNEAFYLTYDYQRCQLIVQQIHQERKKQQNDNKQQDQYQSKLYLHLQQLIQFLRLLLLKILIQLNMKNPISQKVNELREDQAIRLDL